MPTRRGACLQDGRDFSAESIPVLRQATRDLSYLLERSYSPDAAMKLVGDRYQLRRRQRLAVRRAACGVSAKAARLVRCVSPEQARGRNLWIDGFNLLITCEAAMSNSVVLRCADTCYRDIAGVHGTYRRVSKTGAALGRMGSVLAKLELRSITWLLDRPVSNSGRLRQFMEQIGCSRGWPWKVVLVADPDALLRSQSRDVVASNDSVVLDECSSWLNLGNLLLADPGSGYWIVDLSIHEETACQEVGAMPGS